MQEKAPRRSSAGVKLKMENVPDIAGERLKGSVTVRLADDDFINPTTTTAPTVNITNDLERRIADAFQIFDHHGNRSVDVREIGSIIRYLGCVPDENEICQIISATEMEDSSGVVHLSKFLPHVEQLLLEHKMEPVAPERLLKAFQLLDPENKGHICRQHMSKLLMEEGEPFTQVWGWVTTGELWAIADKLTGIADLQEEVDEMMAVAVDSSTNTIPYEYFINQLMVRKYTIFAMNNISYKFGIFPD